MLVVALDVFLVSYLAVSLAFLVLIWAWWDHLVYRRRVRELQRRTLETERSLRQLGSLANEVAHEIKNPLTAILCSAETLDLLIGKDLDECHRSSLKYIKEYGDHLLRLVSDFLDVSRAETGNVKAKPEAVKIKPVLDTLVGLLNANAVGKQISLKTFLQEDDLEVYSDPKHLKQILFNLMHNAVKYTEAGGEVRIIVKQDFPHDRVLFAVRDNGVGIEPTELPTLFDPYTTSDVVGKKELGVGLGLSLVKTLVNLNGGQIAVESKIGVGTAFEFFLPKVERIGDEESQIIESDELDLSRSPESAPLVGQRFLVVDQDLGSREATSRLIEAMGGVVDRVALAIDAVEALGERDYDAVMIDETVDGVFAYELARMIREDCPKAETTIIIASDKHEDRDLMLECGADRLIAKPLNGKALLSSLLQTGKYSVAH